MLAISIDNDSEEAAAEYDLRPAAPKRRRGNERGERLAGFTAAARTATLNEGSASRIQACQRGHIIRRDVARLRPPSAGESASSCEEIAEEIEEHEVCDGLSELLLRQQDSNSQADAAESVLENSYTEELESSNDSTSGALAAMVATATALRQREQRGEAICSICLNPMFSRRRAPTAEEPGRVTLECGHKYHRRCLLSWCRQQRGNSSCPQCRAAVAVRGRSTPTAEAASSTEAL